MNVFVIPSWYPSHDHPINGIFNKEQAIALALLDPQSNFCVSLWGQKDESNLLWSKDHLFNVIKLIKFFKKHGNQTSVLSNDVLSNLYETFTPALTWTRKFYAGNIINIIKANEKNLKYFERRAGKINIIHAHAAYPAGYIAFVLSKRFGIPYVITEQITPFPSRHYLNFKGNIHSNIMEALIQSNFVVAVSPALKNKFINVGLRNSVFIPNLTDETFFMPGPNVTRYKKPTFFMLGRMVEQKGVPVLLNSIAKMKHHNISFRIGGDGEEIDSYKALANKLHLNKIIWLGELSRAAARDELQGCDAFVLPSIHENLPLVLLEAIACGKPIIATDCGGPEYIVNENNGILAKVGDSDDLANKMDWMMENINRYNTESIREDFLKRFSRKVVITQIMEIYEKAINNQLIP